MQINCPKYFLAANSGEGFVSHFGDCFDTHSGWRTIIIKGGPGTGKSSFMKYIAVKAADRGYGVELCPCSSDPESLDGVIIRELKTVLLDGTSPHIVEPKYAGVCEEIINLGAFWRSEVLRENADKIITVTDKNKKLLGTASAYIAAASELIFDTFRLSEQAVNLKKAEQFALNTASRLIPKAASPAPREWVRFLGGVTPKGVVAFSGTVEKHYKNTVIIDDKYGGAANIIMNTVRKIALAQGYEIIRIKNPFLPSRITDHILIPELSLAFVREYDYISFAERHRRIHARRFEDVNVLRPMRSRMIFNRRVSRELLLNATEALQSAKSTHDQMEKYYIDAMDFEGVTALAQKVAEKLF